MSFNNEQNIKRRIGILTFLTLLVCGAMVWGGTRLKEVDSGNSLLYWKTDKIEQLLEKRLETIIEKLDSMKEPELIDSPIDLLPADKKGDAQDSIRNILKDILKYYEQQAG
ncbi:MAG TPA: hypothetical protein PKC55_10315 [Dysgonomonas sp.]|uniref:hypothetical protein n=1 Tax=unclassified Dysgonomonas TaxID=2630389 RepID=UPI0025C4D95D|nr:MULTISPECIES: hypothetical protein [unclassified Dysgonomonas]HML65213.1 hypothetical protein [Dysgonomonas sp.]